jgi:hypothetical protein
VLNDKELKVIQLVEEDISYQNYFFRKLKEPKWFFPLKAKGYFNVNNAPDSQQAEKEGYYSFPSWNVLSYLERISEQVNMLGNEVYIDELLSIIRDVTNYKDSEGRHKDNFRTWWSFIKILLNIPNNKIPDDVIDLIPIWLESKFDVSAQGSDIATKLLPKFLQNETTEEDIRKAEKIIAIMTAIKPVPLTEEQERIYGRKKKNKFLIDYYWLKEAFDKYAVAIGEKCSAGVICDIVEKIRKLLKENGDAPSYETGTYKSFYDDPEYSLSEPLDLLTYALKKVLNVKARINPRSIEPILKEFLNDEYLYFPKMALFIIGKNTTSYERLFWDFLEEGRGDLIMDSLHFGDELKHILRNLGDMTPDHKKLLKDLIEKGPQESLPDEDREKYIAVWKQKRYRELAFDPDFKELYEKMIKITHAPKAELRPAIGRVETRWGPGPSPLSKEELLQISNEELAVYLSEFKTQHPWEGPSVGGLADMLKEAVKEQPEKFVSNLSPFLKSGYLHIYEILWGIRDAWNGKKQVEWDKLFKFIKEYIASDEFWQDRYQIVEDERWHADHKWVIGIIGELIQDGSRDDGWAFSEKYIKDAEEILFTIFSKLKKEEQREIKDPITHALNTIHGKMTIALIYLALRIARIGDRKGTQASIKWSSAIKTQYENLLKEEIIEAYTLLGQYMPNLFYLDEDWVRTKIKYFTSIEKEYLWSAFMYGYLFIGRVYDDLYTLMRSHYLKAIEKSFEEESADERLGQHISLGYLKGREDFSENSLFGMLIKQWLSSQIMALIQFFWMQRNYLLEPKEEESTRDADSIMPEDIRGRILFFWEQVYEKYKDNESLNEDDKKIISRVGRLAIFLPEIKEKSFKWLLLSARFIPMDFNSPFFIECLDMLKDKGDKLETGVYLGGLFLEMLKTFTPDYDKKHIRPIIEFLFEIREKDTTDMAKEICDIYGRRGNDMLRDIYEKYRDQK